MLFPFLLFSRKKSYDEFKLSSYDWNPQYYEFHPLGNEWIHVLRICECNFSIDYNNTFEQLVCDRLDIIYDSFAGNCEGEYRFNPRYRNNQWIYEFEDSNDVINKLIDDSMKYFEERMYPLDKEFCDMILPKVREKLFEIGRDYFSVQVKNQSNFNYIRGIRRK